MSPREKDLFVNFFIVFHTFKHDTCVCLLKHVIFVQDRMSPDVTEETSEEPQSETLEERVAKLRESLCTSVDFASLKKYKRTDFRRELLLKQLKDLQRFSRLSKQSVSVKIGPQPRNASAITVDTTRAGSNIDVLRLCLKELNWREVSASEDSTCLITFRFCKCTGLHALLIRLKTCFCRH